MREFNANEKFIFVSYAHKDKDRVIPIVKTLKDRGYNIWFDENLEHGASYHNDIATHILKCTTALVFVTRASAESAYCQNEITYAYEKCKKFAIVYLDKDVKLAPGIDFLLHSIQYIAEYNYSNYLKFMQALFNSEPLKLCINKAKEEKILPRACEKRVSTGDVINVSQHFELLNLMLGKTYEGWGRCTRKLDELDLIWMISLDGKISNEGWRNTLSDGGEVVIEKFVGNPADRMASHKEEAYNQRRHIFDVVKTSSGKRAYIFRGVFAFDLEKGDNDCRVWKKISDTADYSEFN